MLKSPLLGAIVLSMAVAVLTPAALHAQTASVQSKAAVANPVRQTLAGHVPAAVAHLLPTGRLAANHPLRVSIGLPLRNQAALAELLRRLYDASDPAYHQYLSSDEFIAQFGPAEQDYEAVKAFARANGLTIVTEHANRMLVSLSGSAAAFEQAFHVTFHTYAHPTESRDFYAPDAEPSLDLATPILNISGLDNYSLPRPAGLRGHPVDPSTPGVPNAGSGPGGTYLGYDFRKAYTPAVSLTGKGQKLGLVEFDGYYASDIALYVQKAGLPSVPLRNVYVDGYDGSAGDGNVEVALDIDMAIAMAPGLSEIVVYECPNSIALWVDILNRMAADTDVKQFSCSWGGGSVNTTADQIFQQMAVQGQSFFNAVGASDAFTGTIPFPSDNPYITEVGGTTLTNSSTGAYSSEKVWNWGDGVGSSGGISTYYPIPNWQQGAITTNSQGSFTYRNTPDVALTADNIFIYADNGFSYSMGGTSASAPLWAAFLALVNEQGTAGCAASAGFINPTIYSIGKGSDYASNFHDITKGNNKSPSSPNRFNAVAGYDLCTGWGTPNGLALISSLAGAGTGFLSSTVDPLSGSAIIGSTNQTIYVTITGVTNAAVAMSIPGVTNLTFRNDGITPDQVAGDFVYSATLRVPAAPATLVATLTATASGRLGITNVVTYNVISVPGNDLFANAIKVPSVGASYLANNRLATVETNEPALKGSSVGAGSLWWLWTPAATGPVFIDTTGSRVDTLIGVYTGSALTNLQLVAVTNSTLSSHQPGYLTFTAQAGVAYHFVVASTATNTLGSMRFAVVPNGQPDTTVPDVFVTSPLSGLTVTNQLAVITGTAADPNPQSTGVNLVYLTVNGCTGSSVSGTTNWNSSVVLKSGLNTIQAFSVDEAGNYSDPVTIQLNYFVLNPLNDFFASATPLAGLAGTNSATTVTATKEVGEPNHAGNAGGKSVWWSYTPTSDGVLTLSTTNSSFDTLLALYSGSVVSNLTLVAANDDAFAGAPGGYSFINQAVHSNVTYGIVVDGYNGVSGTANLTYSFVPAALYQVTAASGAGGQVQISITNSLGGVSSVAGSSTWVAGNTIVVLTAIPDASHAFSQWTGTLTSSSNPLSVTVVQNTSLTAAFAALPYTDGFESGGFSPQLSWTSAGDAPWLVQSNVVSVGQYAARSGVIQDGQSSTLMLTANVDAGTGTFDYKVSSELDFDLLSFYVNGVLVQSWSGEVGWASFTFPLPAGTNTLRWSYTKDASLSQGLDAAFIDNLNLPVAVPLGSATPAYLQMQHLANGALAINLSGQTNRQYVLQSSTNLVNWINIATNTVTSGSLQITDPSAGTDRTKFYRAVAAP